MYFPSVSWMTSGEAGRPVTLPGQLVPCGRLDRGLSKYKGTWPPCLGSIIACYGPTST